MKASDAKEWLEWIKTFKVEHVIIIALIIVIAYWLKNPDKVLVWKGIIQSIFIFSKRAQKESISNRVSGSIKSATKKMLENERALYPESVFIEWMDGDNETRESFLRGQKVIIRMNRTDNIDKTTSVAAIEMVKHGVIPNGKRYMGIDLTKASDYLAARKLVASINNGQSLSYFDEEFFRPLYNNDEKFKLYFDKLLATDHNGMYTAVFLNELRKLADLLFPEPSNEKAHDDIVSFLDYLVNLCTKKNNNKTLDYNGEYIKVVVAFTGSDITLNTKGYDFYANKCFDALNEKSKTVYLFSLGMKRHDAIEIERRFHEMHTQFAKSTQLPYIHVFSNHQKKEGMCIEFEKNLVPSIDKL